MNYEILEARVRFDLKNQVEAVTVLANCTGYGSPAFSDVRAISASTRPIAGYYFIPRGIEVNMKLFQKVAGGGVNMDDRDEIFQGWKKRFTAKQS